MTRNDTALYTTFYPGVERYLHAWWKSVQAQTDREFDIWIGLDAMNSEDAEAAMGARVKANWLPFGSGSTPANIRQEAFALLTQQYKSIVLVDADDVLCPTRVEAGRQALSKAGVGGCALRLIDDKGSDLGGVFAPRRAMQWETFLIRHNVFGLSNTAYRAEVLRQCLPLPANCILIDWLLATRAWALGEDLSFDYTPRMFYRQHANNTAGVLAPFTEAQVLVACSRVLSHYQCALESPWLLPRRQREALTDAQSRVDQFRRSIERSPAVLNKYVIALNGLPSEYVWWWCVAHADLESIWKN